MISALSKVKEFAGSVRPERFFLVIAPMLLLAYNLVTPPLQAPDEFSHFYRTWQVAEGGLLPVKADARVGGYLPYEVTDAALPFKLTSTTEHKLSGAEMRALLAGDPGESPRRFVDFPNTAYYSPVSYLPQAVGVAICVKLGGSPLAAYYAGRLAVLVAWLGCMYLVVLWMPGFRWLTLSLLLLPMHLFLAASLSADVMTNMLSFLLIALVFRLRESAGARRTELAILFAVCLMLSLSKLVYVGLLLLLFLIPGRAFGSRARRLLWLSLTIALSLLAALWWSSVVLRYYTPEWAYNRDFAGEATLGYRADYHRQLELVLSDPAYLFRVLVGSLFEPVLPYPESYIGQFGAFLGLSLPKWMYYFAYAAIFFIAATERNKIRFGAAGAITILVAALASVTLLILSQHLTWDEVGSGKVWLLQGRYFIPVFPLLFMLAGFPRAKGQVLCMAAASVLTLVLNATSVKILFDRYVDEPYYRVEDIKCGAETMASGGFRSENSGVVFGSTSLQADADARTGRFSALSSPGAPFVFECRFPNVSSGDLFEIELWKKGGEVALVVAGGGKGCENFWIPNTATGYRDRNGWEHMHMAYKIPQSCPCTNASFVVHNTGGDTVLLDDLRIKLRRKQECTAP